jgi:hypothetical protein
MLARLELERRKDAVQNAISRLNRTQKLNSDQAAELARLKAEQETLRVDELRAYGIDPETLNQVFGNAEREACLADFVANYGKAADPEDDGEQKQTDQPDGAAAFGKRNRFRSVACETARILVFSLISLR